MQALETSNLQPQQQQQQQTLKSQSVDAFIHRSGIEQYQRCPRSAWFTYHHLGTGIVPLPTPNYFDIGSAVHEGLACSMMQLSESQAVKRSLDYYSLKPDFHLRHVYEQKESLLLIEALIRAWYANGHENFHKMYTVLHVEHEVHIPLSHVTPGGLLLTMHWMSRPDAIVKEKGSPLIAGISWKTIDDASNYRREYFSHDLQGLMEMTFGSLAIAQPPVRASYQTVEMHEHITNEWQQSSKRIDYIQTIFLQKGTRVKPSNASSSANGEEHSTASTFEGTVDSGQVFLDTYRKVDCPLIYAHVHDPHAEFSPFYNLEGLIPNHCWKTQYWKPGNKTYNRITDTRRILLEQYQLKDWIAALASDRVFPTAEYNQGELPLDKFILWDQPIMREQIQASEHLKQLFYQESRRHTAAAIILDPSTPKETAERLWREVFPQYLRGCRYPTTCEHSRLCFSERPEGQSSYLPQGYQLRISHHEPEVRGMDSLKARQLVQLKAQEMDKGFR